MSTPAIDTAILLRRHRYGESSLVVHALSRSHGRVHLIAKGAYRPTSGYCGALDLFDTLELQWTAKSRSELKVLRGARPTLLRRPISRDPRALPCRALRTRAVRRGLPHGASGASALRRARAHARPTSRRPPLDWIRSWCF